MLITSGELLGAAQCRIFSVVVLRRDVGGFAMDGDGENESLEIDAASSHLAVWSRATRSG